MIFGISRSQKLFRSKIWAKFALKRVCIVYPESILVCVFHFVPGIAHLFCDNQLFFGFLNCSSGVEFLRPVDHMQKIMKNTHFNLRFFANRKIYSE